MGAYEDMVAARTARDADVVLHAQRRAAAGETPSVTYGEFDHIPVIDYETGVPFFTSLLAARNNRPLAELHSTGGTLTTDIVTQNVPVRINAQTTTGSPSYLNLFETDGAGHLTYTGTEPFVGIVHAVASIDPDGGTTTVRVYIGHNHQVITHSSVPLAISGGSDFREATIFDIVEFQPGDHVELYIANTGSAADIKVASITLLVTS